MRTALLAAGIAAAVNLVLALILRAVVDPPDGFDPFDPGGVVVFTAVLVLLGFGLLALLARFTADPVRIFSIVAIAFSLVSILAVLGLAEEFPGTTPIHQAAVAVLHVAPLATVLPLARRLGR